MKVLFRQIAVKAGSNYKRDYRNYNSVNTADHGKYVTFNLEKESTGGYNLKKGNFSYQTSKMVDFEGKPRHQLQFIDGKWIKQEARKQHVLDYEKKCPTTNYKTDYSHPEASGDVQFFKRPHYPVNHSLKFGKSMMSHYNEMNTKMLAEKQRSRQNALSKSMDGPKSRQFLLAAEKKE